MKKFKYLIFIMAVFFCGFLNVNAANRLDDLNININIDENGVSHVTETWNMVTTQDTEIYKEEKNLGNMSITNFKVKDEKREYTLNNNWNIDGSFSQKKNTYGINYTDDGLELCWGISEYGSKTYTISYDIVDSVFNTSDAQVFYMRLVNDLDFPPKNFSVTITGPNAFEDKLDVWGYGYKGYAYVNQGKIHMSNEEKTPLSKGDYAVLLVKFPMNTFNVSEFNTYTYFNTFNDVLEMSEDGKFDYNYNETSWVDTLLAIISTVIPIAVGIICSILVYKATQKYKFGPSGKQINTKEINAFRDIPCDKDMFKAFFLAQAYSLNKKNTDFVGTLFLKWMYEGKISIASEEKRSLFGSKEEVNLVLNPLNGTENEPETAMYNILKEASVDGILDKNELKKWAKDNYDEFYKWFDKAEAYGRSEYINKGFVVPTGSKFMIQDALKPEAIELAGLKKYLIEFSNMKEKQAIEVKLWREYLMVAQLFGIANKVAQQFKNLYPEVLSEMENSNMNMGTFIYMNSFSNTMVNNASSARSAAQAYSGGGGGFSSGGGGGGSFGGGGGGSR